MSSEIKTIKVDKNSLPVSCPPKDTPAWDMHPRIYIALTEEKSANCPYCGNSFELTKE